MANKIIIDGIDVSECKHFDYEPYAEPYCKNNDGEDLDCQSYPNCNFKQLKRKEQECEEKDEGIRYFKKCLDNSFKRQKDSELWWEKERNKLTQKLKEKEQECEELRNLFEDPKVRIALTDVRTGEREIWRKLGNKAQKYKQALDEIEEVVRQTCKQRCTNECLGTRKHCGYGKILNIINKARRNK